MSALHDHRDQVLLAVDDLTAVTLTLVSLLAGDSGWRATAGLRPREGSERLLAVVDAEMGLGDTAMSVLAGLGAGLFMSLRFFLVKGAGRAN